MAPIILGNASSLGTVNNIIVPYKDQYRVSGGIGGVAIGNTADTRVFSTGTVVLAGTNLTISTSAVGAHQYLNLSIADPAAAANYISAGNNITLSTSGFGTTISVTGLQPAGAYLTTAALSDHNHGGQVFATGNIGGTIGTYTTASATGTFYGWSLSIPDFLVTAAESNHSHTNYAGVSTATGTTAGTDVRLTLDTYGLSIRTPRYITTAANISHVHGVASGTNITIGSSSNGLALSVGNYITTAAPVTHIHGSISTVSTTGTAMSYTSASDGLTLGVPQWITTAAGGNNLSLSGNTAGTLTEMNSGTVTIVGGDNITLSQSGNAFTIIGAASGTNAGIAFSLSESNTSGTKSLISSGTLYIEGGNNITVSQNNNTIHIIGNSALSNAAGIGTTTNSITGSELKLTLSTDGLNIGVPQWITGGTVSATASNSVYAGDYISLSTNGINTTVSAVGLQATSAMSLYQQTSNNSLFLGTADANNFVNTAFSTLLQHTSDNSLSLATSHSSLFQLTSDNTNSLGTSYTSHTHSNLYIALSESSLYRSSVLSNTFAVTSHTHSNLYIPVSASTAYQTSVLDDTFLTTGYTSHTHNYLGINSAITGASLTANTSGISINIPQRSMYFADSNGVTFGGSIDAYSTTISASINVLGTSYTSHTHSQYLTTAMQSNMTSAFQYTSNTSIITSAAIHTSQSGSIYFSDANGLTWGSSTSSNFTTITASIAATAGADGGNILAVSGSTAASTGTIALWNANNFTFGISDSTRITASFSESTHAHPYINTSISSNFLTTAALSNHTHGNISLALTNISGTTSSASNGMTLSLSGGAGTAGGGVALQGSGTYSQNTGTVQFVNSNGITFGLTNNTMTASVANNVGSMYFSDGNGITFGVSTNTNSQSTITASVVAGSATGNYAGTVLSTATTTGVNIVGSVNTSGISLSIPNYVTETGDVYFTNSNGISWGSSTTNGSTTFTQDYAAAKNIVISGNTSGTMATISSGTMTLAAGNNITLSQNGNAVSIIGAAGTGAAGSAYAGDFISLSTNGSSTTISIINTSSFTYGHGSLLNTSQSSLFQLTSNNSLSLDTGYTTHTHSQYINTLSTGSVYFANSLGTNLTWSSSTTGNSTYIGASVNAGAGNISWELEGNNTAGTTGSSGNTLYLSGGNNVTLSGNSNTIVVSVNATGANDGVNILAAGTQTANTTGTVILSNSNGLSFGMSNNSIITGSYTQSTHAHPYVNTSQSSLLQHTSATSNITANALNTSVSSAFQLMSNSTLSLGTGYTTHTHNYLTGYTETQIFIRGIGNSQSIFTSGSVVLSGQTNITVNTSQGTGASSNSQYLLLSGPNNINEIQASNGTAFGGSLYLSGYSNITISMSNGTINFSAPSPGAGGGVAVQGSGTYSQSTGTIQFANSNGLTFGLSNNGVMTGSVANNAGSLYFSDSNGVSFGVSTNTNSQSTITASVSVVGGGVAWGDGAATITSGTALLSDANNVSFGINGQTVTASIPAFIGTSVSTATTSGTAIALSGNTAGITMTYPQFGVLNFSNANGHSFSSSVNGISTSIYIVTA